MDIKSMTLEELKTVVAEEGEKPFRASQLYDWMHRKLAEDYGQMTNLSSSPESTEPENFSSPFRTAIWWRASG